jgi:hypothetical protein
LDCRISRWNGRAPDTRSCEQQSESEDNKEEKFRVLASREVEAIMMTLGVVQEESRIQVLLLEEDLKLK